MKSVISAAVFAAILATPALADKKPVKPVKPVQTQTCGTNDKFEWIVAYHLDQIEMAIQEMRQNIQRPPYPKPKDDFKNKS